MGSWGGVKAATCGGGEGSAGGSGQAEEEQECVDPALVAWAVEHMPATARAAAWLQPFKGQMKVALCAHLDIKNAIACKAMVDNGIAVYATTCNPATVRPAVLAFLEKSGVVVDARRGAGGEEWAASVRRALLWGPDVLCEMGGHLSEAWHALPPQQRPKLLASVEATGSGVHALQRIAPLLDYPVFEWDTQGLKLEVHNRHMVGLTAMHAFFLLTHLTLHFKTAAVFGYGPVGEGVAKAARAYGAQQVVVVEKDSTRAVQARMDNFQALVLPPRGAEAGGAHGHLREVLAKADVVVTATGVTGVFGGEQAVLLKPGAFVMNVGHENTEIDLPSICGLYQAEAAIPDVTRYSLRSAGEEGGGMEQACPHFFLITDGCMANLASPRLFGDSLNAFDALLATMMGALRYVMAQDFKPAGLLSGLHRLPDRVSAEVADILMQR